MSIRKRLLAGDILVGPFCSIPHPVAIELAGGVGFDFLMIDAEHAIFGRDQIEGLVRAGDVVNCQVMFRVPGLEGDWISSVLDAGAAGVLIPRIETAEQACAAVLATRYPPVGKRGVGPGRASGYGSRFAEYLASANDELLLAVQVETAEGLANVEDIARVEGVDLVFVGPGDLSVSIGAAGPANKAKLDVAIGTIIQACLRQNRLAGIFHLTPATLAQAIRQGLHFHIVGADGGFLVHGAMAAMSEINAARALAGNGAG